MKKIMLLVAIALFVISVDPANAQYYGSRRYNNFTRNDGFVGSWSGINPTEAYRDLPYNERVGAAVALTSQAIAREQASVNYANAQATRANIENLSMLAETAMGVRNALKYGGRHGRW